MYKKRLPRNYFVTSRNDGFRATCHTALDAVSIGGFNYFFIISFITSNICSPATFQLSRVL